MYKLINTIEDKELGTFTQSELIDKVSQIVIENEDFGYSVLGISDALEYVEDYCDNLEIITL